MTMERKIGEIFEYNGEWYQCIIGHCNHCSFYKVGTCKFIGNPYCAYRNDKEFVCFKKLEKTGEPLKINGKVYQGLIAPYRFNNCSMCAFRNISCKEVISCYDDYIFIEIKQNKEDMEEKKLNLKPFSLEAAKQGKPVCTRDGRKARIICFDKITCKNYEELKIIALVREKDNEDIHVYNNNGKKYLEDSPIDLMMLPEKKTGWVNLWRHESGTVHPDGNVYSSKEDAVKIGSRDYNYVYTVKIEWEE